ncbi:protein of unknown function [Candidatus Nitrotoga arctica]|uniref:Uncharacterized protein n=1 Tax=Candidatus Nitrotoga arctica TaxID=453162 RepID=A0ABN8AQL3_9PROT|nr:protein of unknown function [Candidatus Nitrotoga arctica]
MNPPPIKKVLRNSLLRNTFKVRLLILENVKKLANSPEIRQLLKSSLTVSVAYV